MIWFIGGELELRWGEKYYRRFLLGMLIGSGFIFLALSFTPLSGVLSGYRGTAGVMMGLLVAYAIMFSERELHFMFFFPLKAKYFCLLIAAIQLYGSFFSVNKQAAIAQLLSMVLAYALLLFKSRLMARSRIKAEFREKQRDNLKKSFKLIKSDDDKTHYWQ